ncbi:TPA: protein RepA [Enterobacter hormaechei subsp. xiangfangensis]|nr:protein RepA [Enterobacter hormaechei subsp. xiangfangensis]
MTEKKFIRDVLFDELELKQKELTINEHNSVQPIALMRLGVFVPRPSQGKLDYSVVDASEIMSRLEIARAEGYDDIKIIGPRLDMDTDFKVWIGVIRAFSEYGLSANKISLSFSEFADFSGFPGKRKDKKLRQMIHESLLKIRSKSVSFTRRKSASGSYNTGLLKVGYFDADKDIVELEADEKLWELYADYRVLLQQYALKALPKKETAQALYTFIESLPKDPAPLSFERIRERLMLTAKVFEQNRLIKKAIQQLIDIGYLQGDVVKQGRENFLLIHKRNPKLNS